MFILILISNFLIINLTKQFNFKKIMHKTPILFIFGLSLLVSPNLFAHAGDLHFHNIDLIAFCLIVLGLISSAFVSKKLSISKLETNK